MIVGKSSLARKPKLLALIFILYSSVLFLSGVYIDKEALRVIINTNELLSNYKNQLINFYSLDDVPSFRINIKPENYKKLEFQRYWSLKMDALHVFDDAREQWLPAKLIFDDAIYTIKLRLKGMRKDHWGEWPSLKIKVKNNKTIMGMKRFALQHPDRRGLLNEWYFHQLLKYYGLLALKYDFVKLNINGKAFPVYAVEENMDNWFLEREKKLEGLIVQLTGASRDGQIIYSVNPFNKSKIKNNPRLQNQLKIVKRKVMAIPRNDFNRLTTYNFENVFDVEKLAKFFAILDLTGQEHAVYTTNTRYYYNPITSLLEPIGFDHSSIEILHRPLGIYKDFWNDTYKFDHLYEQLFANREFFRRYVEIADKLTRQECCLDEFFSKIADTAKRKLSILQVDRPGYHAAVKQKLYVNRKLIREFLFSGKNIQVKFENYDQVNNLVTLRIFNNGLMPMEIEDLFVIDGIKIPPAPNIKGNIIKGHFNKDANQGTSFNFLLPIQFNWQAISRGKAVVRYKPFGTDIAQETDIVVHASQEEVVVDKWNAIQRYKNIESVEFLKINETEKTIVIKPGNWTLTKDLLIPKGYRLIGRGEIRLNLLKSSKITSFSPVEIVGEKDRDIVIYSEDGTGQGLAVINASQQSLLNHVIFRNLSEPVSMDRNLTGAITFYRSPLKIQKVHFRETRSEDALHVIDSNLDMNTVSFSNISSDAIDCDFCNIELFNVTFRDIGNDAIDVSGSKGHLKSIEIKNVQDKGISIGEGSNIVVHTLTVAGADIGLASKDSSVVAVDRVSVEDSHIGFAVYTKKPEYGPARLSLSNVKMSNVEEHYYIQVNSDVLLDGKIKDDFEYKTDKYDKSSS